MKITVQFESLAEFEEHFSTSLDAKNSTINEVNLKLAAINDHLQNLYCQQNNFEDKSEPLNNNELQLILEDALGETKNKSEYETERCEYLFCEAMKLENIIIAEHGKKIIPFVKKYIFRASMSDTVVGGLSEAQYENIIEELEILQSILKD